MSKHNYSQYSKKPNKSGAVNPNYVPPATTPTVKMELKNETPVEQVVKNETIAGTVVNCAKLNVRAKPNIKAEIVGILDVKSEVKIDADKSDNEWFKICTTTGIDGYCMRKFIEAHV